MPLARSNLSPAAGPGCHHSGMDSGDEAAAGTGQKLSRQEISEAVNGWGWRLVLGALVTSVRTGSLAEAADLAARLISFLGGMDGCRPRLDLRDGRLLITLESAEATRVTGRDIELAHRISAFAGTLGLATVPENGPGALRSVQLVEIGIDALDIGSIRPFWKAVMGYADEFGYDGPEDSLADPYGQGPAIWFQQMDAPRPQRNRIHFDVVVPHDEARHRIDATIAAGGRLVYDAEAPAFWVLADPEGNEVCVCTWQGRDGAGQDGSGQASPGRDGSGQDGSGQG
jgi:4a-hydroxytetrahydrobiopterin dehydratase